MARPQGTGDTDYDEAELFVNGKSQGRIKKVKEEKGKWDAKDRLDRYRLRWNDVKYEPGELKVVVYDGQGRAAGEETVKTAGKPARLRLDVWTQQGDQSPLPWGEAGGGLLKADGEDLAFVTVSLVDKQGTLIPDAAQAPSALCAMAMPPRWSRSPNPR